MAAVEINWNPTHKDLRFFAGLQIVFFAILAAVLYYKHGFTTIPVWMVGISVIVGVLGLAWPPCVRFIYITWMAAVFPLGWVGSHIILFVVFFFVVTPIGLIMKTFGRDPMRRQFDRGAVSYWIARKPNSGTDRYFKQF